MTGSAVTTLTIEDIERRKVHLASDLLREVPEALKPRRIQITNGDTYEAKAVEAS